MNVPSAITQHPRSTAIIMACVVAITGGVATPFILYGSPANSKTATASQTNTDLPVVTGTLQKGTPTYKTILPAGHSIADYGGWTRVSPPKRDPVYAYVDHIGAIPINVSQQPIPKDFDDPNNQVHDLAEGYGASKVLKAGATTVYIGTSAKGPQSVIFIKNGLLVLIKASAAISDEQWQEYIQSLS